MKTPAASSLMGIALMAISLMIGMGLVACMKVGDGIGVTSDGSPIVASVTDPCIANPTLPGCVVQPVDSCVTNPALKGCVVVPVDSCKLTPKPASCPAEGPSFAAEIAPILSTNCEECHSPTGQAYPLTQLSLTKADAYALLVNVPSMEMAAIRKPMMRVKPGKPDSSFLYIKLTKSAPPGGGGQMPLTKPALPADKLELIRAWIAAGALP